MKSNSSRYDRSAATWNGSILLAGSEIHGTRICEVSYLVASMLASSALLTAARRRKRYASGDSSS